ncbi:uncharacterized protein LOC141912258 [Tubulanus polymorphus]|uniref:uncharacterized protein LOC141912258 n=1 Tax=Tubulanus polymorphus TaxID=672921 RepID=UPI003DA37BAF
MESSLLVAAAGRGDVSTVRKLIRKQVDVSAIDASGSCAISKAAQGGHFEIVNLLLQASASPNSPNGVLVRPLHFATAGGHVEVVKLLLQNGAEWNTQSSDGRIPRDLCRTNDLDTWDVLHDAENGILVGPDDRREVPDVPLFSVDGGANGKKKNGGGKKGGGKKGAKGKKGKGKKKGKKKKK